MRVRSPILLALLALAALAGCKGDKASEGATAEHRAEVIGPHECAVCGMVVREQPAPRAQLVHRDGERAYFCSLGDLVQYLRAPSPHGKVEAVFVEVQDPAADPRETRTAERPWSAAGEATYVVGVERSGPIMGPPVLAYSSRESAAEVAREHGGEVHDWAALKDLDARP